MYKQNYLEEAYHSFLSKNDSNDILTHMKNWIDFPVIITDSIFRVTDTINCEDHDIIFLNNILESGFIDSDNLRMLSHTIEPDALSLPDLYFGKIDLDGQTFSLSIIHMYHRTTCVCVLFAFRSDTDFNEEEQELLKRCGHMLMCMYALTNFETVAHKNLPNQNVIDLLKGNFQHEKEMHNQFSYTQVLTKSLYYVLLIGYVREYADNVDPSAAKHSIRYHLAYFQNIIQNSHSIIYDKCIVTILSTDMNNKEHTNFLLSLKEYAEKEDLFIISSNPSPNMKDIPILYGQVRKGLDFINDNNKAFCNVAFYRQYALRHMYQFSEKHSILRSFCHPAVLELADYDRKNHTDYLHTLYCYLRYNQQLTLTANEMFIHRNTLSYRLEKIFQMTGLDRNNGTEIAHVLISIEIYYKGYPSILK